MTGIIGKIPSRSKIVNEPLTDGGILLGSGAEAITATAALADSEMIVGDGTTDPAIESGATLRTSIGVGTGDAVTFGAITGTTLDTGQGANELYDMDQNVKTDSAVTFTTVDTGQGANELYDMNQNVLTTSGVTHDKLTATSGVLFGTDTAAANTLHDYEEGTWTPKIVNNQGENVVVTDDIFGRYTKIGRQVCAWFAIEISSVQQTTPSAGYMTGLLSSTLPIAHKSEALIGYTFGGFLTRAPAGYVDCYIFSSNTNAALSGRHYFQNQVGGGDIAVANGMYAGYLTYWSE